MALENTAAAPDEDARYSNALLTWKINVCFCVSNDLNNPKGTSSNYPLKKILKYLATKDHPKLCVINTFSLQQINSLLFCGRRVRDTPLLHASKKAILRDRTQHGQ